MTQIAVLGSTGSIGQHTLEIVDQFPGRFEVYALAIHMIVGYPL